LQLREPGVRAQLDATSTTWLADQQERSGLIDRKRNDPDHRAVRLWLTQVGHGLRYEFEPELAGWELVLEDEFASHHSSAEIATFRTMQATLINVLPEGDDLCAKRLTS